MKTLRTTLAPLLLVLSVITSLSILVAPANADGSTWTNRTAPTKDWLSVTYGTVTATAQGLFVAVAQLGEVMTSPDGVTWTEQTPAALCGWNSVTYGTVSGQGLFVAVALGTGAAGAGCTQRIMTSPDGITWTGRNMVSGNFQAGTSINSNGLNSVTFGGGRFVAVGSSTYKVVTSTDGVTWTGYVMSATFGPIEGSGASFKSVSYGGGKFVAVASSNTYNSGNGSRAAYSNDGTSWTFSSDSFAGDPLKQPWESVTYGIGGFVAVSSSGTTRVMTSTDGTTWTAQNDAATQNSGWKNVSYGTPNGSGVYVAIASSGTPTTSRVMTSPDGVTWTLRSVAASSWNSVAYGDGAFVAVARSGGDSVRAMTSGSVSSSSSTSSSSSSSSSSTSSPSSSSSSSSTSSTSSSVAAPSSGSGFSGEETSTTSAPSRNPGTSENRSLEPGQFNVTVNGVAVAVTVTAQADGRARVSGPGFSVTFGGATGGNGNEVFLEQGGSLSISGSGYQSGTRIDVVFANNNQSLGSASANGNGSFSAQLPVSASTSEGEYEVRASGTGSDGAKRVISLGVSVGKANRTTVAEFAGFSSALTPSLRAQVREILANNPKASAAKCRGFVKVSTLANREDAKLARQRAASVCSYMKRLRPSMHTSITRATATETRRRVEVTIRD